MREDLGPRRLEYLRAELPSPRVDFAEPLAPVPGGFDTEICAFRAICQGDVHPQNLLFDGREITAVLDWPNVLVADPAYDVAATRVILERSPLEIVPVSRPGRWAMAAAARRPTRSTPRASAIGWRPASQR